MNKILCLSLFLIVPATIATQESKRAGGGSCTERATTQKDLNACAAEEFRKADADLNATYSQLLKKYADDAVFVQKLKVAEETWVRFRDAHMSALDSELEQGGNAGSVFPMCKAMEMARLTTERTGDLKRILNPKEGDVCAF